MIDGIHIDIPSEAVQDSDILEFKRYGNGERANYKGLIITRDNLSCSVRGSLHKYFNDGKHNYNDFTLSDFIRTISDLEKTLNINADIIRIGRIEAGVNLDIDMDVDEFIGSVILFNNMIPVSTSQGVVFQFREYDIKLYKKELKGHKDKLRIEIACKHKSKRDRIIKEYTTYCNTLSDLTNSNVWQAFGSELETICDNLILIDREHIDYTHLKPKDAELLTKGISSFYWTKKWNSRATRMRYLDRFVELSSLYGGSNIREKIKKATIAKIKELIDIDSTLKNETFSPFMKNGINIENETDCTLLRNTKNETDCTKLKNSDKRKNETDCTVDKGTKRFTSSLCEVTSLSLEIGIKQGSYLSAKGVEYYFHNQREIYDKILLPRLSEKWHESELNIQFREIAHSIRNEKYNPKNNPRNNLKTSIKTRDIGVLNLFEYSDMLREDKRQILTTN
ncbi:hypothetical protein [Dysgonomonas sp.]